MKYTHSSVLTGPFTPLPGGPGHRLQGGLAYSSSPLLTQLVSAGPALVT